MSRDGSKRRKPCRAGRGARRLSEVAPAQAAAAPAQAFAGSAVASVTIPWFFGAPALEWAGAPSELGALTEEIAALTAEVPVRAHAWAAPPQ